MKITKIVVLLTCVLLYILNHETFKQDRGLTNFNFEYSLLELGGKKKSRKRKAKSRGKRKQTEKETNTGSETGCKCSEEPGSSNVSKKAKTEKTSKSLKSNRMTKKKKIQNNKSKSKDQTDNDDNDDDDNDDEHAVNKIDGKKMVIFPLNNSNAPEESSKLSSYLFLDKNIQ